MLVLSYETSEIGIVTASVPRASRFVLRLALRSMKIYNEAGISIMQVSKWGNSLAVRLPATVVEALDLKEGDEIEISVAGKRDFKVARDRSTERALDQLRQMKWSFPPDFKFNREEINER
jgi:antitoxin MazE